MTDSQKICSPDSEPVADTGGFIGISFDAQDEAPTEPILEGGPEPIEDDTPYLKQQIVRRVMGGVVMLPNVYFQSQGEEPYQSLDLEKYGDLADKSAAELAALCDVNPWLAQQLERLLKFERQFGATSQLVTAMVTLFLVERQDRLKKQEEEKAKADAEKKATKEAETQEPVEAADDPQMTAIITEPEDDDD